MMSSSTMSTIIKPRHMHICNTEELKSGISRKCHLKGGDIKVERPGLEKTRIHLKDLNDVTMQERNCTIEKHRYDFIICLKSENDVVYLKADTRHEMEEWYKALLTPLTALGWKEHDNSITRRGGITEQSAPTRVPAEEKDATVSTPSSDGSRSSISSEWSLSSKSTESSPTDERLEPSFYPDGSSIKAPVPCTDLKEHNKDSIDVNNPQEFNNHVDNLVDTNYVDNIPVHQRHVDTDHYEVRIEEFTQEDHMYMALLNRGATALDPVAYDDQIFSTGAAARNRRVGRNSEYISIESGAYQSPYQEPEVKLRNPKSGNLKSVDALSPLRSRENSVCDVVQPHQYYPTYNALRSSSRPLQWDTPTSNDAANTLRSKENTFQPVHSRPRNLEIKYSGRSSNDGRRSSPPLPARDGITNHACLRSVVSFLYRYL
ncbi:uncharacterized protein [Amphiura filiformis]|uniref:uncharacterized protein n=1 Tax=Amphiura filiformis TaxID=82378 RepID=UPI003B21DD09